MEQAATANILLAAVMASQVTEVPTAANTEANMVVPTVNLLMVAMVVNIWAASAAIREASVDSVEEETTEPAQALKETEEE